MGRSTRSLAEVALRASLRDFSHVARQAMIGRSIKYPNAVPEEIPTKTSMNHVSRQSLINFERMIKEATSMRRGPWNK